MLMHIVTAQEFFTSRPVTHHDAPRCREAVDALRIAWLKKNVILIENNMSPVKLYDELNNCARLYNAVVVIPSLDTRFEIRMLDRQTSGEEITKQIATVLKIQAHEIFLEFANQTVNKKEDLTDLNMHLLGGEILKIHPRAKSHLSNPFLGQFDRSD